MTRQSRGIAKLRHRVLLCRQDDLVEADGTYIVNRESVLEMWASIDAHVASAWSSQGAAMKETQNKRSHTIRTRYRPDLQITSLAWVYEERLQSPPRWFKVLKTLETEDAGLPLVRLDVRLVERGDLLQQPTEETQDNVAMPMPFGVNL